MSSEEELEPRGVAQGTPAVEPSPDGTGAAAAPLAAAKVPNSLAFLGYKQARGLFSFFSSPTLLVFVLNKGYVTLHTQDKLKGTIDSSQPTSCEWEVDDTKQCSRWSYDPSKSPCVGMVTLANGGELQGPVEDPAQLEITLKAGSQGEDTSIKFFNIEDKALFSRLCQAHIDHSKGDMMAKLHAAMKERNLNIVG